MARNVGVEAIRLVQNSGVGFAVRTGLQRARDGEYQRAVVVDADGQHDPSGIRELLACLDRGADVAVGSRFAPESGTYHTGFIRRTAMRTLARVVRKETGRSFSDVTSGYRAFDASAIAVLADRFPSEYLADTVGALLIAHAHGMRIDEVAVRMRPRTAGRPSARHVHLVRNFVRILWKIRRGHYRR